MLGLIKRHRARKEAAERWEKLGDELQNNVDNAMLELWKDNLENRKLLSDLEKKHNSIRRNIR